MAETKLKTVQFEGMRFSVPTPCTLQVGHDGDVARASCEWNDGSTWIVLALRHTASGGIGGLGSAVREAAAQPLCRFLAETELRHVPPDCRAADLRLSDVAKAKLPKGAEACSIGTGSMVSAAGAPAHRRLIVCHLAAPGDISTAIMLQVVSDAPQAGFDRVSMQIVASLAIRP